MRDYCICSKQEMHYTFQTGIFSSVLFNKNPKLNLDGGNQ